MPRTDAGPRGPHPFTTADRALIQRMQSSMSASQLLELLNQRHMADCGDPACAHTIEQLEAEVSTSAGRSLGARGGDAGAGNWTGLRTTLKDARRSGVLARVSEPLINDFAVVFRLNAKQVLQLKDVLLRGEGPR